MIIAVTMNVSCNPSYYEMRDTISHDWIGFLENHGITPLLIPNSLSNPAEYCLQMGASGFLLTSGNDLGPQQAEDWPPSDSVAEERDQTETALLGYAVENRLPLLGVCRGVQFINTYFGGSLSRDLASETNSERHVASNHQLKIVDPVYRKRLNAESITTNSYHNQGVTLQSLASTLKAIAVSEAGVVEALYHPSLPILAIQWHPERRNPEPNIDAELFQEWLGWCSNYAKGQTTGEIR